MHFCKYHGVGNDYLVLDPVHLPSPLADGLTSVQVQAICHRQRGPGGDGIVYGPLEQGMTDGIPWFACQIWNPDGSQAEVSGNGLRIFTRYLADAGYLEGNRVCLLRSGGRSSRATLLDDPAGAIRIALDRAVVLDMAATIPVVGTIPMIGVDPMQLLDRAVLVDMGNPHCVLFPIGAVAEDRQLALTLGPLVERSSRFPDRTNVQFARVLDTHRLHIEIWERGAGYTLASGSSSCAAALAAVATGRCQSPVQVEMAGGRLAVTVAPDGPAWQVTLTGPVAPIYCGEFAAAWLLDGLPGPDPR